MADISVSLSVDAEISNPQELALEISNMFPQLEERGGLSIDTSMFERMLSEHTSEMRRELYEVKKTVKGVMPLLKPIYGRQSLEHVLSTQLGRIKEIISKDEELAGQKISEQAGDVIGKTGMSSIDFAKTIVRNVEEMINNLNKLSGRKRYSQEIIIKDSINSLLAILESENLEIGKGKIKDLPKDVWSPLIKAFYKVMDEADFNKIVYEALKEAGSAEILKSLSSEVSVAQLGGIGRTDIGFEYKIGEGTVARGAELKTFPDLVSSNIAYASQIQKVGARTPNEIEQAINELKEKITKSGMNIDEAIKETLVSLWGEKEIFTLLSLGASEGVSDILSTKGYIDRFITTGVGSAVEKMIENIRGMGEKGFGSNYQEVVDVLSSMTIGTVMGKGVERKVYAKTPKEEIDLMRTEVVPYDVLSGGIIGGSYAEALSPEAREGIEELFGNVAEEIRKRVSQSDLSSFISKVEKNDELKVEDRIDLVMSKIEQLYNDVGKIQPIISQLHDSLRDTNLTNKEVLEELIKYLNKLKSF